MLVFALFIGMLLPGRGYAAGGSSEAMRSCLAQRLEQAAETDTVGELRQACREQLTAAPTLPASAIESRGRREKAATDNPFAIVPHRPNYLLFGYNLSSPNQRPFREQFPGDDFGFDKKELKFQLSYKFNLGQGLFDGRGDLWFAYTNRSFWQAFNRDLSSPFRETNHEPEAWLAFDSNWELAGIRSKKILLGGSHQSNGRGGRLSRSWNRLYTTWLFEAGDLYFALKPWWRIPESAHKDDNPDIGDYLGNFELLGSYKWRQHSFGILCRNNLQWDGNRGAIQLDWSFPLHKKLRGYLQWFNGYGESLIDYNASVNSIGIGLQLTDWL